ncbi:MAG TPA: 16S rRNA (uracil(1498)-N(3))-methyltransferase [Anaerolineae bacterium]|nr:16S rRNA (uracil(1498)-N(3))-methyltransferase [Anaerolineae bacterium]
MHRFFLPFDCFSGKRVTFPQKTARQIRNVLRLKSGEMVLTLDNSGHVFEVQLQSVELKNTYGVILDKSKVDGEVRIFLSLYISLTQRDKMEFILQKGTEIGVSAFIPFISRYSMVRDILMTASRRARWERILKEAAEQSERGKIPLLNSTLGLDQAVEVACTEHDVCLAAWEEEGENSLSQVLSTVSEKLESLSGKARIALFIGPEGGFTRKEVQIFHDNGVQTFSLGKRILRMETAAVVAPALIFYALGELNPSEQA